MAVAARHVDKWVSEGIISQDQAESIRRYERQVTPSGGTAVEALGYLGAVMVASAAFIMVSEIWRELSRASRLSVLSVTAASLVIIGMISARDDAIRARRFGQVALMLAVPAIGLTAGVQAGALAETPTSVVIGSAAAWVVALPWYLQWRSNFQHLALFLATISVVLSAAMNPFDRVPDALPGTVILLTGTAWVLLATTGRITPRLIGEILGATTALIGSVVLAVSTDLFVAPLLALFVAASIVGTAFGVNRSRTTLTVIGILGLVTYIPWFTTELFGPTLVGPLVLLAMGAALALWTVRKK